MNYSKESMLNFNSQQTHEIKDIIVSNHNKLTFDYLFTANHNNFHALLLSDPFLGKSMMISAYIGQSGGRIFYPGELSHILHYLDNLKGKPALIALEDIHLYSLENQHNLFNIFNQVYALNINILVAGRNLENIKHQDLLSRLTGFTDLYISHPSIDILKEIFEGICFNSGIKVSESVLDYIMYNVEHTMEVLSPLAHDLCNQSLLKGTKITIPDVKRCIN